MSYVALATDRFDEVVAFYGNVLGFAVVESWDRPTGRGRRFNLGGIRLEIFDNERERSPLKLGDPADRLHVVVEVDDIEAAHAAISVDAPAPAAVSWGASLFQLRDPDGVAVTYLQWDRPHAPEPDRIRGEVASGLGRGQMFTQLDWAHAEFIEKLGIDPFPGTLNLIVEDDLEATSAWLNLRGTPGIRIENPNDGPNDCDARCYPVSIDRSVEGAIILPEVREYPHLQIEVIAPVRLRDALGKSDGDSVELTVLTSPANTHSKKRSEPI